jgi:hypothetical protein
MTAVVFQHELVDMAEKAKSIAAKIGPPGTSAVGPLSDGFQTSINADPPRHTDPLRDEEPTASPDRHGRRRTVQRLWAGHFEPPHT